MRERVVVAVALVVLAAGVVGIVVHHDRAEKTVSATRVITTTTSVPGASTSSTSTTAAPATPSTMDALVTKLEAWVSDHRGLAFKQPVKVTLLDTAAFTARISDASKPDPAESAKVTGVLRALHLIDPGVDVGKAYQALLGGAVLGFYDSKTKELVVRGDDGDRPDVREVLVHELTHALQDQWFGLDRPDLDKRDDDGPLGFQSVFEGDAVRIQEQYRSSMSAADQRESARAQAAQGGAAESQAPRAVLEQVLFPYEFGLLFTKDLQDHGGHTRLDAAFRNPPTTSEQVMHPDLFRKGEPPKQVATPPADGAVIEHNVFGEFGFLQIFEGSMSISAAAKAAAGWGGDEFVVWTSGSKTCVRDNVVMDTDTDRQELLSALRTWSGRYEGITVTGTSPITITSCA